MSAATQDIKVSDKMGSEAIPDPPLLWLPVEANTIIYGGTMVASNANGNAVPASASGALKLWGRCERQVNNLNTNTPFGAAAAQFVSIRKGPFFFNQDGTISQANIGQNCFAVDDNTVSLSDAGGTRPYAGVIMPGQKMATTALATTSLVAVWVGMPNAYATNPELQTGATQYRARGVVTSLQAYTGSGTGTLTETANGAWAAQDGITNAVGDVVFIQAGTTNLTAALDAGPWQISGLGSAGTKWVLIRPDWWQNGAVMPNGIVIDTGGEGTLFAGVQWKSFAAVGSAVVGTNDPTFYPNRVTQQLTLVAGTVTVTNVAIRLAAKVSVMCTLITPNTATSTVGYGIIASPTIGYTGTASAVVDALVANQTKNATDVSTINVCIQNW